MDDLSPGAPLLTPDDAPPPLLTPEAPRQDAQDGKRGRAPEEPEEDELVFLTRGDLAAAAATAAPGAAAAVTATPNAEKYRKMEKVGVGAYGSVFMAENTETKQVVAIKATTRKEDQILGGFPLSLIREISILRRVKHEGIVQIHEVAQTSSGDPLIVMEFCQASLLELLQSPKHELSFSEVKYIVKQVLDATAHLHGAGVLHRDLATKNVLFNLSGEVKVCDFGISRLAFAQDEEYGFLSARNLENPNQIVSLPYRAIELLLGDGNYGPALDVWAVGCIMAEVMLCQAGRRQPFFSGDAENPNKTPLMLVEEIFQILGRPTEQTWPGLNALPLLPSYQNSGRVASARPHRKEGDEREFLKRFFTAGEGVPANTKYCLTESCYELLGALFALCPKGRITAKAALEHRFFTKEKPMPEWHAWHWALASKEIPRGNEMRQKAKEEGGKRQLLKQLSREEPKASEAAAAGQQGGAARKNVLQSWRQEAEKLKMAQSKAAEARAGERLPPGWTKHWSASKQKHYYHDSRTGKNSWSLPTK